jgi:hypothetical protein
MTIDVKFKSASIDVQHAGKLEDLILKIQENPISITTWNIVCGPIDRWRHRHPFFQYEITAFHKLWGGKGEGLPLWCK